MIKLYNSLTKKIEEFKPIKKNEIKIYTCGPTVYDYAHIGNLRAYVFSDILSRTFKYFNFKVLKVMNLTDVDDKTILASKKIVGNDLTPNEKLKLLTKKYINYFILDITKLNITPSEILTSATENIDFMEKLIQKLIDKDYAYFTEDGIYFDIKKDKNYGQLTKINFSKQEYNLKNRMIKDEYDKKNIADFAIWKFKNKDEEIPFWQINLNKKKYFGRPGWHIECSAMSYKYLGETFDIHTGGIDNKFPHHENEIAQTTCALNIEKQANFWIHNNHLFVDGKKMSKSLNNFYTLKDLEKKGYSPIALRGLYLKTQYRQELNFTFESLDSSIKDIEKINNAFEDLNLKKIIKTGKNLKKETKIYLDKFEKAIKQDLNTALALAILLEYIKIINKNDLNELGINNAKYFLKKTDKILGLIEIKKGIPKEIIKIANLRMKYKMDKNYIKADEIRREIDKLGYKIKDDTTIKTGFILIKKNI